MWYQQLTTPAAVIDLPVLRRNLAAMAARADQLGVRLRPHVKTHRCAEIARLQTAGRPATVTVSTLAEARYLAAAGFRDLTYAVPLAPGRLPEVAGLARQVDRLCLLVDHKDTAAAMASFAEQQQLRLPVFLKVDCGAHRAGVDPDSPHALALAEQLDAAPWLELRGILTHAGHAYRCRDRQEIAGVARQERELMTTLHRRLLRAGIAVPEVSIGSTPTISVVEHLDGITEVRPGNYVFFDAFQAAIGVCTLADVALTVLATVVGCYPERNELVIDAGALALSKDAGPAHVETGCGFGRLRTADGRQHLDRFRLVSLTQEHGVVRSSVSGLVESMPPGTMLRIAPNHSCLTAAMFERYQVLEGDRIVDQWSPVKGW